MAKVQGHAGISFKHPRSQDEEVIPLVEAKIDAGVITDIDSADIPTGALSKVLNAAVRYDRTGPRAGTVLLTPTKPDSEKVLELYYFKQNNGTRTILRAVKDSIYKRGIGTWVKLTGTLHGGDSDYFQFATVLDNCVFTNNGRDEIQLIDPGLVTFAKLGNAAKFRHVTGFYNRVVGANLAGSGANPTLVGWSGDGNIAQFDPLIDISAGSTPLVESPSDLADFITGVYGNISPDIMVVTRERSIWLATKQPVASQPFFFFCALSGVGCSCPYATAVIPGGMIWIDFRKKAIYMGTISTQWSNFTDVTQISIGNQKELFKSIDNIDPNTVVGTYNSRKQEYSVSIQPAGSSKGETWTFKLDTKSMSYREYANLSTFTEIDALPTAVLVDSIPAKVDTILDKVDDYGGVNLDIPSFLIGKTTGEIEIEQDNKITDSGVAFTSEFASKNFSLPTNDSYVARVRIEILPRTSGILKLYYSKDSGVTWLLGKVFTINQASQSTLLTWNTNKKTRKFMWKLTSDSADYDLIEYEVHIWPGARSTK